MSSINSSLTSIDNKLTAPLNVRQLNELIPVVYDAISVTSKNANGDPLVVLYKVGGLAGTTVATITMAYDVDGDLISVVRT